MTAHLHHQPTHQPPAAHTIHHRGREPPAITCPRLPTSIIPICRSSTTSPRTPSTYRYAHQEHHTTITTCIHHQQPRHTYPSPILHRPPAEKKPNHHSPLCHTIGPPHSRQRSSAIAGDTTSPALFPPPITLACDTNHQESSPILSTIKDHPSHSHRTPQPIAATIDPPPAEEE
ncbi:hypothetical protein Dimus_003718, partial [Dionaea muscipula]